MLIKKHREQKCSFYSLNSKKASKIEFFFLEKKHFENTKNIEDKITPLSNVLLVFLVFFLFLRTKNNSRKHQPNKLYVSS